MDLGSVMQRLLVQETFSQMANISVSPPSVNGTTNDYGGVTGLTLIRSETTSDVTTQTGTDFRWSTGGSEPGPIVAFSMSQSGYDIGLSFGSSTLQSTLAANFTTAIAQAGATNVSGGFTTDFRTSAIYTGNPGTTFSFTFTFLRQGTTPTAGSGSGTVTFLSPVNTTSQVTTTTYTFTNNTGDIVTIEGTSIANGASSAVTPVGQFDITYVIQEETEEETEEETTTAATTAVVVKPVIPSAYVYGTGATGFGTGLTGYFYPLYTDINASALSAGYHVHTFTEYVGYTFYMPNGAMNHAISSRPTAINKFITGIAELDNLEPIIGNPDYATLLPQIKAETDPVKKQALIDQCYQFIVPLTQAEEELFAHINNDYVEDNPNSTDGTPATFISHVGVYYDEIGRTTGTPEAQQLAVVVAEIDETVIATGLIAEYGIGEYGVNEYDG